MVSKTTLCNQLTELLDGNYVHSLGPVSIAEMKAFMENETEKNGINLFDRFPILEEYVYGPLLRGKNRFIDEDYNKTILDRIDLFIYCYPGLMAVTNWGDRAQMDGVKENVVEVINRYNHLVLKLQSMGYNVKEYNYRCDKFEDLVNEHN